MKEKIKESLWKGVVCVGLLIIIWGGYFCMREVIDRQISPCRDNFFWSYQVDSVSVYDNKVTLSGFAFQMDNDAISGNYEIVLRNDNEDKNLFLKMQYKERVDVKEYFKADFDCSKIGFEARANIKDLYKSTYEVLLRVKGEKTAYRTGVYLINGKLTLGASELLPLSAVEGMEIKEIIEKGKLRAFHVQKGLYVYQYMDSLYWIRDNEVDENEDLYMRFQLQIFDTDNVEDKKWIDESFWFSQNEISEWNTGKYRVAKKVIPSEYRIDKFRIGEKEDNWEWIEYFRPWYYWSETDIPQ